MKLSQIEKGIPQTLTNSKNIIQTDREICLPKQPGQINASPRTWGLGSVQKKIIPGVLRWPFWAPIHHALANSDWLGRTIAFYQVFFQQGRVALGKWCIGPQKGHLRTPGMDFFCTVPRPHFLGRALIWPGCFGEHILGLFGLYSSSLSSLWDSFLYLGKLHWFLYLLLSYFYDPGMFIFCWSSNFVEKVVLNESMSAKMAPRVSYLVYYYCR